MSQLRDLFFSQIKKPQTNFKKACGRYAPSPTGSLHFGNLRTALVAWLQARLSQGRFILRMEDIDLPRARPGSAEQIMHDLSWLGLDWDEGPDVGGEFSPYTQSERFDLYQTAIDYLCEKQRLFSCACSRKDIAQAASAPHASDQRLIYPGTCRPNAQQKQADENETALRFFCPEHSIHFDDVVLGPQKISLPDEVGDFVVKRRDGLFSYQLAVALDDALMGVTDVVRGADLIDSTAQQILLLHTFGFTIPRYWHIPLVLDKAGKRMAKRDGGLSVDYYREKGMSAAQLIGQLAASLELVPPQNRLSAQELLQTCSLDQLIACLKRHS